MSKTEVAPAVVEGEATPMTHRQVLEALSGLLMGMFVAILAGTVVSTSLPRIISDLKGDQASYTWVVTATLLATTVSTPIWGKFSDLMSRKLLVQLSLVIFVLGSALAGFSQDTGTLIVFRVLQGLGAGGLTSLVQVILSDIISPRDRGRYMGFLGAVMAIGTAGGPLVGGLLTDSVGWRWNFYVAIPFAIAAIILIQRTLHLPKKRRKVSIDFLGLALIAGGVSLLLIWVTLAGHQFEWGSATSLVMVIGAAVILVAAVFVEMKVKEPILPIRLFASRTFTLVVIASLSVGVALFGTSVFLAQYMQLSRGKSPTEAGLLTLPMVFGLLVSSTIFGAIISRTGRWKPFMILGASLLTVGLALMATITYTTPFGFLFIFMAVMGIGLGMVMQNLVLVVQNSVDVRNIGAASSAVAFFRSLGGTIGVSVLGAILGTRVAGSITDQLSAAGVSAGASGGLAGGTIPNVQTLPGPIRAIVENAYGQGVGEVFLIATPLALVTLICIIFLPKAELGTKTGIQQAAEKSLVERAADTVIEVTSEDVAATPRTESNPVIEVSEETDAAAEPSRR